MTWILRIPAIPPSGNVTKRMHWARYSDLMELWWLLVRAAPGFPEIPKATGPRRVTVELHGKRRMDRENRMFSVKPLVDVMRPPKFERGIYGPKAKKAGQPWTRNRIGHSLILEDDEDHLDLVVTWVPLLKGEAPHTVVKIEDMA